MKEENHQNSGEVTLMLRAIQDGDKEKINDLIPTTIKEIRRIAKRQIHRHNLNNNMSVTALVNELYIKFGNYVNAHDSFLENSFNVRSNDFFALCTTTIQRLIYDYCRKFKSKDQVTDSLDDITKDFSWLSSKENSINTVLIVKEALLKLREQGFERQEKVITLKYFGGFSDAEISEILEISIPTVQRDLRLAESKLYIIINPEIKSIYKQAIKIPDKSEQEKFIEEKCGDDERLLKAIKLLVK